MKRLADAVSFNDLEVSEKLRTKKLTKVKSAQQIADEIKKNDIKSVEKKDNTINVQIIKSVLDSYLSDGSTTELVNVYIPDIVSIIHQQDCLESVIADHSQEKTTTQWVTKINSMIKVGHGRLTLGLYLLVETIRVSDYDLMTKQVDQWIKLLSGLSTLPNGKSITECALTSRDYCVSVTALSLLVEKAAKWNDLRRAIVVNATLQQIVSTLSFSLQANAPLDSQSKINSLISLKTIFTSLTSSMRPHLARTESAVYPLLFNGDRQIQECAASLIASLSQSVSLSGADHYWDVVVQRLLIEMHQLTTVFYKGIEPNQAADEYPKTVLMPAANKIGSGEDAILSQLSHLANIELPKLQNSPHNLYHCQLRLQAFHGLHFCLTKILTTVTQSACSIPLDSIIKLICRILNIGFSQIRLKIDHSDIIFAQLNSVITHLHLYCYQLISTLVQCFRKSLLPFSRTISSLLLRPLRLKESYSNSQIQVQIYQTIRVTIESLGSSCSEYLAVPLAPLLLRDIQPFTPEQQVNATPIVGQKKNKNNQNNNSQPTIANNSTAATSTIDNVDAIHIHNPIPNEIRILACSVISTLLLHCGSCLSMVGNGSTTNNNTNQHLIRFEIDQSILSLLLQCQHLQQTKRQTALYQESTFNEFRYRAALYSCITSSVLRQIASLPPVLPYALRVLTIGMNDEHPKVRSKCSKGLAICQSLIHPQAPNLQAPAMSMSLSQLSNASSSKGFSSSKVVLEQDDFMKTFGQIATDPSEDNQEEEEEEESLVQEEEDDDEKLELNLDEDEEDEEKGDKLDISLNDVSDEGEENEDEEEDDKLEESKSTKKPVTSNIMANMKTNLFDQSIFNTTTEKKTITSTTTNNNNTIKKQQNDDEEDDDEDDDEDLPDLVDEPPSSDEEDQ